MVRSLIMPVIAEVIMAVLDMAALVMVAQAAPDMAAQVAPDMVAGANFPASLVHRSYQVKKIVLRTKGLSPILSSRLTLHP